MSDSNQSQPTPKMVVSTGTIEEWSHLLPAPDRSAFVAACTEAEAEAETDDGRLQAVLSRYFSTWKTNLMADDLSLLQRLATCSYAQIRDCVKVICLEDDFIDVNVQVPEPQPESAVIWPRHEDGQVVAEALGLELLISMLAARQLCPDRFEIRDKHDVKETSDPEIAALLACNILDGADLAITNFVLRKESPYTAFIAAELSAEHQGRGMGFSMLQKSEVRLTGELNSHSHLARQILLHAPMLKELSLSFSIPRHTPHVPPFILDNTTTLPALEKLELSSSSLSAPTIMAILSKSKQSLTSISFRVSTLGIGNNSSWAELLGRVGNEFPNLTHFYLSNLSEGLYPRTYVAFPGLEKDSVIGQPYRNGLRLIEARPPGGYRIRGAEYRGPNASHVLGIVVGCITTWSL